MEWTIEYLRKIKVEYKSKAINSKLKNHFQIADWYMQRVDEFAEAISILEKAGNSTSCVLHQL